jgi:hypothetical protein
VHAPSETQDSSLTLTTPLVWRTLSDRLQTYQISRHVPSPGEWGREAFAEHAAAVRFLRRLRIDAFAMLKLRAIYSEETGRNDLSRESDGEVIERLAWQLLNGRLRVWRPVTTWGRIPESPRMAAGPVVAPEGTGLSRDRDTAALMEALKRNPRPPPPPPSSRAEPRRKTWIEIVLVGEDDRPISGKRYVLKLPDGSVRSGFLNQRGTARLGEIDPGDVEITFPELDRDAWEPA